MYRCLILFACLVVTCASAQELRFSIPVEGVLGRDVVVVNHVDHDTASGRFRDHTCGIQTYDGHDGTDFVLRSFRQMDSGVFVVAAAPGRVIAVVDSLYDRNKVSIKERGFGNYVAIQHDEGYISYYAHIRKNSAIVTVGSAVTRNQRIALVGSSGNSSDPHVHFEVWRRIDPFAGLCADNISHWNEQPAYNTSYRLLDHGLTTWPPLLDTIRERPPKALRITRNDSTVTFWSLQQGIQPTDELVAEWYAPDNTLWFRYSTEAGIASEYYYWWTFINRPSIPGIYHVRFSVNGVERARDSVDVEAVTSVADAQPSAADAHPSIANEHPSVALNIVVRNNVLRVTAGTPARITLFDVNGRLLESHDNVTSMQLPRMFVVVRVQVGDRTASFVHSRIE